MRSICAVDQSDQTNKVKYTESRMFNQFNFINILTDPITGGIFEPYFEFEYN